MNEVWVECTLSNIFETVTGNTPPKGDKDNYGDLIPFVKPPQILNNTLNSALEYLSEKGAKKSRLLPVNSVLVTCIGNLGRVAINKVEVAFNQQINAIKPISHIEPKFTFYQAQSVIFRNQLESLSTSTTVALVNKTSFNSVKIKIAPLPIQKAIVRKIEELFSSLDSGIADLKKAQEQLVIYRQAVLKKAFEGELQLLKLNFRKCLLKDAVLFIQGIQVPKDDQKSTRDTNDVRFLRIIDFTQGNDEARFIENPGEKYYVKKEDIAMVRYGASTGFVCSGLEGVVANNLFRIIPILNIDKRFLYYFFKTPKFYQTVNSRIKGAAMPAISFGLLNDIEINFPQNINEQKKIVQEIESRLSVCDKVEESIAESLEKAKALRQSILKKAFEGKLLSAAEIARCKQDKDYEPAGVLLEKIRAEKKLK